MLRDHFYSAVPKKSNLHYIRRITPMRIAGLRILSPHHCAAATQLLLKKSRTIEVVMSRWQQELLKLTGQNLKPRFSSETYELRFD